MTPELRQALVRLVSEAAKVTEVGGYHQYADTALEAALDGKPYDGRGWLVHDAAIDFLEVLNNELAPPKPPAPPVDFAGLSNEQIDQHHEEHLRQLLALSEAEWKKQSLTKAGLIAALARFVTTTGQCREGDIVEIEGRRFLILPQAGWVPEGKILCRQHGGSGDGFFIPANTPVKLVWVR